MQLKAHAAWYDADSHKNVSVPKANTPKFPAGVWMFTKMYLIMSMCTNSAWNTFARFMAYGSGGYVLNNFYPSMTIVCTCAGVCGTVNGCAIVSTDTSFQDSSVIMYGVVLQPTHQGPRFL